MERYFGEWEVDNCGLGFVVSSPTLTSVPLRSHMGFTSIPVCLTPISLRFPDLQQCPHNHPQYSPTLIPPTRTIPPDARTCRVLPCESPKSYKMSVGELRLWLLLQSELEWSLHAPQIIIKGIGGFISRRIPELRAFGNVILQRVFDIRILLLHFHSICSTCNFRKALAI